MDNHLQDCSFWDPNSSSAQLDSALTSMVSSPTHNSNPPNVLRELIGRLGTICNSSASHHIMDSSNFPVPFDPGFPRFNNPVQESRGNFPNLFAPPIVEFADSRENSSSVSDHISPHNSNSTSRKRKSVPIPNPKLTPKPHVASDNNESGAKRSKSQDRNEKDKINKKSSSSSSSSSKNNTNNKEAKAAAAAEAPKDYIHVRARRGQATDAHSLAERVRREKISERMKVLQDLVPGCNKVTGKAAMLDEIINYVQSLQRQVEFLSMKLANVESGVSASKNAFDYNMYHHTTDLQQQPHLQHMIPQGLGASQVIWEDDLHSFVQMGYGQTHNTNNGGIGMKVEI